MSCVQTSGSGQRKNLNAAIKIFVEINLTTTTCSDGPTPTSLPRLKLLTFMRCLNTVYIPFYFPATFLYFRLLWLYIIHFIFQI